MDKERMSFAFAQLEVLPKPVQQQFADWCAQKVAIILTDATADSKAKRLVDCVLKNQERASAFGAAISTQITLAHYIIGDISQGASSADYEAYKNKVYEEQKKVLNLLIEEWTHAQRH